MANKNTEQDFWNKVDIQSENECWNWLGCKDKDGYGRFWFNGKQDRSHRLAWLFSCGEIYSDLQVLHDPVICRNKSCCNPKHLRLGTGADNHRDPDFAKITWKDADEIRELYKTGLFTQRELGQRYGINDRNISEVITLKAWTK